MPVDNLAPPATVSAGPAAGTPSPTTATSTPIPPWKTLRAYVLAGVLLLGILGLVASFAARAIWHAAPATQLPVSGRLEGYQSDLGAKVGGRVVWVSVREGAVVRAGSVLVQLDDAQPRAQLAAAAAAVEAAADRARQSQDTLAVLASQIHEATLGGKQASADTRGRIAQSNAIANAAQAQVAQAAAVLRQAQATLTLASLDRARYDALSRTGDISMQRAQQADTAYQPAGDEVVQQREALAGARRNAAATIGALGIAESTSYNAPIRAAQIETLERQQHEVQAQIAAANADVNQARAATIGQCRTQRSYCARSE